MAYSSQTKMMMPNERSLLMPFSVRHFPEDDKWSHHMSLEGLQDLFPLETVEQILTDCQAWEKREKALNMVTRLSLLIALLPLSALEPGRGLAPLGQGDRLLVA
jgi:hypothetical protein